MRRAAINVHGRELKSKGVLCCWLTLNCKLFSPPPPPLLLFPLLLFPLLHLLRLSINRAVCLS